MRARVRETREAHPGDQGDGWERGLLDRTYPALDPDDYTRMNRGGSKYVGAAPAAAGELAAPPSRSGTPSMMCAPEAPDEAAAPEAAAPEAAAPEAAAPEAEAAAAPVGEEEAPWWRRPVALPTAKESKAEALRRIFASEFGAQVGALTLALVAFLAWSSTALNDEFWMSPISM